MRKVFESYTYIWHVIILTNDGKTNYLREITYIITNLRKVVEISITDNINKSISFDTYAEALYVMKLLSSYNINCDVAATLR